jgi:hypothetical protein
MQAPLQARNNSDAAQTDTARTVAQKLVLADNRPEAVAQRKLAEMMNNSPRGLQQRALSDAIHNSPRIVAQRHEMNALFGGVVKPQGDNAMPTEASLAQHEDSGPAQRLAQCRAMLDTPSRQGRDILQRHAQQVVQRFDPLTMGLLGLAGGAAYGAYRYFRHQQRENTMGAIRAEQANQPINQITTHAGQTMDTPSLVTAVNGNIPQGQRFYNIDINANNPVGHGRGGPIEEGIAEIHERTHISADQAYSSNALSSRLELFNEHAVDDGAYLGTYQAIDNRLQRMRQIVNDDNALSDLRKSEILTRLQYAEKPVEYDPVVNELLAYTSAYGIRANSTTVKALVILARENLGRRNPHSPTLDPQPPI